MWLGLGAKTTLLGFGTDQVLAFNTCLSGLKQGVWMSCKKKNPVVKSLQMLKNSLEQWSPTFAEI